MTLTCSKEDCQARRLRMYLVYLFILLTFLFFVVGHFLMFLIVRRKTKLEAREEAQAKGMMMPDYMYHVNEDPPNHEQQKTSPQHVEIPMEDLDINPTKIMMIKHKEEDIDSIVEVLDEQPEPKRRSKKVETPSEISREMEVVPISTQKEVIPPAIEVEVIPISIDRDNVSLSTTKQVIPSPNEMDVIPISDSDSFNSQIYST